MDLTDICRVFHPAACGTFYKTEHILGYKASINKYKKIEITPCTLSDHNVIKLELNNKRNSRKYSNTWRVTTCCCTTSGSSNNKGGNKKAPGI
jgi:hypothetical protein